MDVFLKIFFIAIVPVGRSISFSDIIIRHYSTNTTKPRAYRIRDVKRLLAEPTFDPQRPTVLYAHGFVELYTDESVRTVTRAYLKKGGYNILLLDWSNLAFGHYVVSAMDVEAVGNETGRAVSRLVKGGLSLGGLHLVGHSLGAHVLGATARYLAARELVVPRLTGLDPAYPGFYPALLGRPLSAEDAAFVDVVHTDAGGFGAPASTGRADFWPNEGKAKQPGCLSATVPLTYEDFCSHWRSWRYWAESLTGGELLARRCDDYDSFVRGQCREAPLVQMGVKANHELSGNFYLRTAAKSPFSLGERGAE
ncbi:pancreatic lipase-related protein 2-like isoform X2 [Choristoneura fumiferana]|uniref:pancreatic lipase-related protein 2-like isoform X2 n=1 Tax=Choristoneura fumiferana TaxID=7141 RepID=UPI003D153F8B